MKKNISQISFFILWIMVLTNCGHAQNARLSVTMSSDRLQTSDRLDMDATYTLGNRKLPPATFAVVLKENGGPGIWQLRWPMIDGVSQASIFFPPSFPKGKFTFYFAVQPRFFRLFGQVLYPPNIKSLDGTIYVQGVEPKAVKMPVTNGFFEVKNLLFENTGIFNIGSVGKKVPAIALDAWLDSAFIPAASAIKEITIGLDSSAELLPPDNNPDGFGKALAFFDPFYRVKSFQNMTNAQKFDSAYVSPAYKKDIIQQFDCLDDSSLIRSGSLENFLSTRIAGFKMGDAYDMSIVVAQSKAYDITFYINETPATFELFQNLTLADIATIKILPQGNADPAGSHKKTLVKMALYTRQGPFVLPDVYRHTYMINGYQPPIYTLPLRSKFFANNSYYLF